MKLVSLTFIPLVVAALAGSLMWASFGNTPFSREVRTQLSSMPQVPRRPATRDEVNALLKESGLPMPSGDSLPHFEIGFVRAGTTVLARYVPRKIVWIAQNFDGSAELAEVEVGGFFWDLWHYAQIIRHMNFNWRDYTMRREVAWFDAGVQFSAAEISYQVPRPKGEWYYCYPNCIQKHQNRDGKTVERSDFPYLAFGTPADLSLIYHLK